LFLVDAKTEFLVRISIESYHPSKFNQDVMNLLGNFTHKGYTLYLKEKFTSIELISMLKTQGIQAFGLLKQEEMVRSDYEILRNHENLHICMMKEANLVMNLTASQLKQEGFEMENEMLAFFERKTRKIKEIKSMNWGKKHEIKDLYQKFMLMLFDIASSNAFIIASKCLNEAGEIEKNAKIRKLRKELKISLEKEKEKEIEIERSQMMEIEKENEKTNIDEFQLNIFECLMGIRQYKSLIFFLFFI
jgi:hypothetical protein